MLKLTALSALTCWCLAAASLTAQSPPPAAQDLSRLGCAYVLIYTTTSSNPIHVMKTLCDHGTNEGTSPDEGTALTTKLKQSATYGPDCTITFSTGAAIRVQQNYCGLAAGKVTAKVVTGDVKITKTQNGSYNDRPGQVWVSIP